MEKLYTMETLAEYLGVSVRTILREKASGRLSFKRIRGQVRFSQEDIDNYLNTNSVINNPVTGQAVGEHMGVSLFTKPKR